MTEAFYSKEHQWVRLEGTTARVGITDFAQSSLGDVVYRRAAGARHYASTRASRRRWSNPSKTASEVYTPIAGTVSAVNTALGPKPELVNSDPAGAGWFFTLEVARPPDYAGLMTAAAYADYVKTLE